MIALTTASHTTSTTWLHDRSRAQIASLIVGIAFLAVGILGFIPGVTTNYDSLGFVDQHGAKLLGVFEVNALHNIVHLPFGVFGIALAARHETARMFLVVAGIVYLVLVVYGLFVDFGSSANFAALNTADSWLPLGLGLGMVVLGAAFWCDERYAVPSRARADDLGPAR
jgi:hypothetical protein